MKQLLTMTLTLYLQVTAAFGVDNCLVGNWQADGPDLADAMGAQMGGAATYQSGSITLEIAETGAIALLAEDAVFQTMIPDTPPMLIEISGYSRGDMETQDGQIYLSTATDYALVGAADVLGTRMEIPVTSADGSGWGQSSGTYVCTEDSLTFAPRQPGSIPPTWRRIP